MQNNKPEVSADVLQALLNLRFAEKCEIAYWTQLNELVSQAFRSSQDNELIFVIQPSVVVKRKVEVNGVFQTYLQVIPFSAVAHIEGIVEVVKGNGMEEIAISRDEEELVVSREKRNK